MKTNNEYTDEDGAIQDSDLDNFSLEKELARFKGAKVVGWSIAVRLYVPPKVQGGLLIPDKAHDDQKLRSCVGLVVDKAKGAYDDPRYEKTGIWCEIGDWVIFPRMAGYIINYNGIPYHILKEDAIDVVVEDPRKVTR